jgi:hypothetical protein
MTDFVNTVTDAQKKLHADMRRAEDMRWSLLPVEPIPVRTFSRTWHWVALCGAVVGLISILRWAAGAGP